VSNVTLTTTVEVVGTPVVLSGGDSLSVEVLSVSNEPGQYTNHEPNDGAYNTLADFSTSECPGGLEDLPGTPCVKTSNSNGLPFDLTALDYGGSITLQVTGTVQGQALDPVVLTLPLDTDADQLPDEYERNVGLDPNVPVMPDGDMHDQEVDGVGNPSGDGLTSVQEYRGFVWGPPLVRVEPVDSNGVYVTPAYVPATTLSAHFRTRPDQRDLFLLVNGYDFGVASYAPGIAGDPNNPPRVVPHFDYVTHTEDQGWGFQDTTLGLIGGSGPWGITVGPPTVIRDCACPFALGAAYANAGIAVHVMNLQDPDNDGVTGGVAPSLSEIGAVLFSIIPRSPNLDVAFVFNQVHDTLNTGPSAAGPILKVGQGNPREWTFATKGYAKSLGNLPGVYGDRVRTFQRSLDHYFGDTPYIDDPGFGTVN